jgi:hypothetical protein
MHPAIGTMDSSMQTDAKPKRPLEIIFEFDPFPQPRPMI